MKIVSERVGANVVVTVQDGEKDIALYLPVETALKLGTTLMTQASLCTSDLSVPEEWAKP